MSTVRAHVDARRRERETKSKAEAQNWSRVASKIAQKTYKRGGFDIATRMAADANFANTNFVLSDCPAVGDRPVVRD